MIAKKKIFLVSMLIVILLLGVTVVSASTNVTKVTKDVNPTKVIKNTDNKVQKTVLTKEKNKITKNNTKKVVKTVTKEDNLKVNNDESTNYEKTGTTLTKNNVRKNIKTEYQQRDVNYYYQLGDLSGSYPSPDLQLNIKNDLGAEDVDDFPITVDTKYKNVLIEGGGHTINGNNLNLGQFLKIQAGTSLTIKNLTIKGFVTNNYASNKNGAVFNNEGELTIINSTFLINKAGESGGVI